MDYITYYTSIIIVYVNNNPLLKNIKEIGDIISSLVSLFAVCSLFTFFYKLIISKKENEENNYKKSNKISNYQDNNIKSDAEHADQFTPHMRAVTRYEVYFCKEAPEDPISGAPIYVLSIVASAAIPMSMASIFLSSSTVIAFIVLVSVFFVFAKFIIPNSFNFTKMIYIIFDMKTSKIWLFYKGFLLNGSNLIVSAASEEVEPGRWVAHIIFLRRNGSEIDNFHWLVVYTGNLFGTSEDAIASVMNESVAISKRYGVDVVKTTMTLSAIGRLMKSGFFKKRNCNQRDS